MKMTRIWAMPNKDTFSIKPIGEFVKRWLAGATVSVDPFARNSKLCTWTNDLNPDTSAEFHVDAREFLRTLARSETVADVAILDMPYSPRQVSDCYKAIGRTVGMVDTQNSKMYREVRDELDNLVPSGGVVLSFGWNSVGMGKGRGYQIEEILLVCHGGAHNDTICVAERKL